MDINSKKIIFIVGPTGIGKTALSINLAKQLETEIISCDSRQFYKELLIGTAPPNKKQLNEVKHHFIHNISIKKKYNAGKFENDAMKLITKIHEKKDIIIAVGGSGLYIDAICKGLDHVPDISDNIRDELNHEFKLKGKEWLKNEVKKIDPEYYNNCDKENKQRLLRALEVFRETQQPISIFRKKETKKRQFRIIKIGLNTEREKLYKKINTRVENMIKEGLLEEVRGLIPYQDLNALQTVGYKELFAFYRNQTTLKEAVENIKKNSRRFAKRQITWFKRDKDIVWFEPNQVKAIQNFIV